MSIFDITYHIESITKRLASKQREVGEEEVKEKRRKIRIRKVENEMSNLLEIFEKKKHEKENTIL